jgi:hypothetical protein
MKYGKNWMRGASTLSHHAQNIGVFVHEGDGISDGVVDIVSTHRHLLSGVTLLLLLPKLH